MPSPRCGHTASCVNGKMIVLGGFVRPGLETMSNMWTWSPTSNQWTVQSCTGDVPVARREHSAVVMGNKIVIFGGSDAGHNNTFSDVAVLDVNACTWTKPTITSDANAAPAAGRRSHTAAISHDNTQMLVFFGYTDEITGPASPSVMVLDVKNWKWSNQFVAGGTGGQASSSAGAAGILDFLKANIIQISAFAGAVVLLIAAIIVAGWLRKRIRRQEDVVFDQGRPRNTPPSPTKPLLAVTHDGSDGHDGSAKSDGARLSVFPIPRYRSSKVGFMWFEEGGGGKSGAKVRKFFGVENQ